MLLCTSLVREFACGWALGPDLALYRTQDQGAYMPLPNDIQPTMGTNDPPQSPKFTYTARTAWSRILFYITITSSCTNEPFSQFRTPKLPLEINNSSPARTHMLRCAGEVQLRQHRVFVLGACIHRRHVRFLRWDRAGALVSDPVDYVEDPAVPLRFFWCLAVADRRMRWGFDETAVVAARGEVELLEALRAGMDVNDDDDVDMGDDGAEKGFKQDGAIRQAQKTGVMWQRRYLDEILNNQQLYPIYKITCDDAPGCEVPGIPRRTFAYLIGKHTAGTISPTGRCTKGYVALDIDRKSLVFVKDFWCSRAPDVRRELEIYKVLQDKGVEHVATAVAGGDVGGHEGQLTITQNFIEGPSKSRAARFHYRVVLRQVGRPLETYENQQVLLTSVLDAFNGHCEAWTKAEILHRDVSDSNILIDVQTGRGFLNDWDLCKLKNEIREDATQDDERVGTWMYMSSSLLQFPKKPNQLSDDLESFVYVLAIMDFRFHLHDLSATTVDTDGNTIINTKYMHRNADLALHLHTTYLKTFTTHDGYSIGGKEKFRNFCTGTPDVTFRDKTRPLARIIAEFYQIFRPFYQVLDVGEYRALYGPHPHTLPLTEAPLSRRELMMAVFQNPGLDDLDPPQLPPPPPRPSPSLPKSRPFDLRDMTHEHLMPAWRMLSSITEWPPSSEKTVDQFKGLQAAPDLYVPSVSRYQSQRRSLLFKSTRLPSSRELTVDSLNDG
ncbi:hypothetical protein DENSPDRAFT_624357 [Dentipellis sp. KUC8613]|nr:hypothetical protein DENSPDRAFT_624357 [Dentipellis sp. KUC8613]